MPSNKWTHKKPTNRRPQVCEPPPPPLPRSAHKNFVRHVWQNDGFIISLVCEVVDPFSLEWILRSDFSTPNNASEKLRRAEFQDDPAYSVAWNPTGPDYYKTVSVRTLFQRIDGLVLDIHSSAPPPSGGPPPPPI